MAADAKKRLQEIVKHLTPEQAETLLAFVEFLQSRAGTAVGFPDASAAIEPPRDIPRPTEETVIKAVKRLRATYPMLDARKLLAETSELMSQHMVQGRDAFEVIEELEVLFRAHYETLVKKD